VTLLAAFLWPVVHIQYLFILPGYDKLFRDYNLKVDDLASRILNLSAWLKARGLVAFAITFVLMAVTVGTAHAVQTAPVSGRRRAAILLIVFGVPCLVFLLTLLTVENTKRTLFEGLRKQ
jgi:type II secretory pathway component PulF